MTPMVTGVAPDDEGYIYIYIMNNINMAKHASEMYGESGVDVFFWFCWVVLLLGRNFFVCLEQTPCLCFCWKVKKNIDGSPQGFEKSLLEFKFSHFSMTSTGTFVFVGSHGLLLLVFWRGSFS